MPQAVKRMPQAAAAVAGATDLHRHDIGLLLRCGRHAVVNDVYSCHRHPDHHVNNGWSDSATTPLEAQQVVNIAQQ